MLKSSKRKRRGCKNVTLSELGHVSELGALDVVFRSDLSVNYVVPIDFESVNCLFIEKSQDFLVKQLGHVNLKILLSLRRVSK